MFLLENAVASEEWLVASEERELQLRLRGAAYIEERSFDCVRAPAPTAGNAKARANSAPFLRQGEQDDVTRRSKRAKSLTP